MVTVPHIGQGDFRKDTGRYAAVGTIAEIQQMDDSNVVVSGLARARVGAGSTDVVGPEDVITYLGKPRVWKDEAKDRTDVAGGGHRSGRDRRRRARTGDGVAVKTRRPRGGTLNR